MAKKPTKPAKSDALPKGKHPMIVIMIGKPAKAPKGKKGAKK